eukprot:8464393-Lingulodinium_polyedra.AAC.1
MVGCGVLRCGRRSPGGRGAGRRQRAPRVCGRSPDPVLEVCVGVCARRARGCLVGRGYPRHVVGQGGRRH